MSAIRLILEYRNLFDDEPKGVEHYLQGIPKEILLKNALYYCSLSTILEPKKENLFYPFLLESDRGTEFENELKQMVNKFTKKENALPIIVNSRTSLNFFEFIQSFESKANYNLSQSEIYKRLLKAYLILNSQYDNKFSDRKNVNEMLIHQALIQSIYSDTNCYYLRIAEFAKSGAKRTPIPF